MPTMTRIGLQIPNFTYPESDEPLFERIVSVAVAGEQAGFDTIFVMDHFFQLPLIGPPELEMFDAYTLLGGIAARTQSARLGTLVTGVTYRNPALLAKAVTALDVISDGRALLGIGAAWYELEHESLGVDFPPLSERFERLEEALQICLQMWSDSDAPYEGKHYRLGRTLNVPQSLQRPHPRILIGGGGEKKTLRMVAQYADACNLFPSPDLEHKLDVLRGHCADVGRDYDTIEKTVMFGLDPGEKGEKVGELLTQLERLAKLGISEAHGWVPRVHEIEPLKILGREVVPAIAEL